MKAAWWKGTHGEWYVVAQLLLLALVAIGPRSLPALPQELLTNEGVWRAARLFAALLLLAAGLLLALAGTFHLGANLAILPRPKENGMLVQNGAYRLVRHPIYSGLILGAVGWALWRNGPLTLCFALALAVVLDIKSRREEQWLAEKFPEYASYRQRVRKLIPFLY